MHFVSRMNERYTFAGDARNSPSRGAVALPAGHFLNREGIIKRFLQLDIRLDNGTRGASAVLQGEI